MDAPRSGNGEDGARLRRANLRLAWILGGVALLFYLLMIFKGG